MITKIAIITGLFIGYLLIGFLLLIVVNKLYCLVFDEVMLDEDTGVICVFFHPIAMPIVLIFLLCYIISCGIEHINDSILEYSKHYEDDEENT